jgi:hypothetical protein
MRKCLNRVVTTTAVVVLTVAGLTTASAASSSSRFLDTHQSERAGTQRSHNWAGYIKVGRYTAASASWTVPTLKATYAGHSATWVGIGGATANDGYLIQTGTEADVVGGRATYAAWWEVITPTNDAPETVFSTLAIHAGNKITATVAKGAGGKWTMTLKDTTTGKSAGQTVSFAGRGTTAEWIQEDAAVGNYISTAPNWQQVNFAGITLNRANPKLQYSQSLDIVDSHGKKEANTTAPTGGNAFRVTWLATGTRTYIG